jgi:Bacteriophage tail sheath protein
MAQNVTSKTCSIRGASTCSGVPEPPQPGVGARTLSSDTQWRYINVRRVFLFVEESIEQGTQLVFFEPNDELQDRLAV